MKIIGVSDHRSVTDYNKSYVKSSIRLSYVSRAKGNGKSSQGLHEPRSLNACVCVSTRCDRGLVEATLHARTRSMYVTCPRP